jgi:hypothetical protein
VQMGMDIPTSTYSCHSLFTFSHTWTLVCPCCPWEAEWRGFHAVVFRVTAPPFGSHPRIQEHSFLELVHVMYVWCQVLDTSSKHSHLSCV